MKKILREQPLHLLFLIIYFFVFAFSLYYPYIDMVGILKQNWGVFSALFFLAIVSISVSKSWNKLGIMLFPAFVLILFFGSVIDSLSLLPFSSYFMHYRLLFPLMACCWGGLAYFLFKRKNAFNLNYFFNLLTLLWLASSIVYFTMKLLSGMGEKMYSASHSITLEPTLANEKPDVYFIVMDGYPSSSLLQERYGYVNALDLYLKKNDFYTVKESTSNYKSTCFSMLSTLNMLAPDIGFDPNNITNLDYLRCLRNLKSNNVCNFFEEQGYEIDNFSIFDLLQKKPATTPCFSFLYTQMSDNIIFNHRLSRDMQLIENSKDESGKILPSLKDSYLQAEKDNKTDYIEAEKAILNKNPKFVYLHLLVPHETMAIDSVENATMVDFRVFNTKFISQLEYGNHLIENYVSKILTHNPNSVIILQGDHGIRDFTGLTEDDEFRNLNAYYFPDKNYELLNDSLQNINTFRVVFNKYFQQKLPLLHNFKVNMQ